MIQMVICHHGSFSCAQNVIQTVWIRSAVNNEWLTVTQPWSLSVQCCFKSDADPAGLESKWRFSTQIVFHIRSVTSISVISSISDATFLMGCIKVWVVSIFTIWASLLTPVSPLWGGPISPLACLHLNIQHQAAVLVWGWWSWLHLHASKYLQGI